MRNCPQCKTQHGKLGVRGIVKVQDTSAGELELIRLACDRCGFTMLFDQSVMATSPYDGGDDELPPEVVQS